MALLSFGRVRVPRDLADVTRIDRAAETPPASLDLDPAAVAAVWSAVEALYRTGMHPAITLVLRRRGRILLKRAIGCLDGSAPDEAGPPVPLEPDAPICLFSASKAISALLLHKLAEQGRLQLSDRVADYIPEFAAQGKERVTIRQLLAHRAGIPGLPVQNADPALLNHWDALVQLLCLAPPVDDRFHRQAYHALTGGFIVGELVRRVSGRELPDVLREWLAEPLGCRTLSFGLPPERRAQAPRNVCTGPKPFWPAGRYLESILGLPLEQAVAASNGDAFLSAVVPAGNLYASADDTSRIFQMLLNGGSLDGVQLFRPETVAEAVRPVGRMQLDGTIMLPLRFSAGFMLGENPVGLFGPSCRQAFGHIGFLSVLAWADPQRDISVALLNTGKSLSPMAALRVMNVVRAIGRACPPLPAAQVTLAARRRLAS